MRVPEGFVREPGTVLRLEKAIYGLKQAPRYWNQLLHNWLLEYGLQQSQHDPCLYFIPNKLYVCFWVDDFLILDRDASDKDSFKAAIGAAFKMKDLGAVTRFLGMDVQRDRSRHAVSLTSSQHIDDMLERFGMQDCKPAATGLPHKAVLGPRGTDGLPRPPQTPYRSLVGSLLYVAMWTRPDMWLVSSLIRLCTIGFIHYIFVTRVCYFGDSNIFQLYSSMEPSLEKETGWKSALRTPKSLWART